MSESDAPVMSIERVATTRYPSDHPENDERPYGTRADCNPVRTKTVKRTAGTNMDRVTHSGLRTQLEIVEKRFPTAKGKLFVNQDPGRVQ